GQAGREGLGHRAGGASDGAQRLRGSAASLKMAAPAAPAAHPPLHGTPLILGTVALSLATFMNVLDSSIANVSIPAIAGDLGVSPSQGTWVITSFAVANAISVPLTGWLTQRFGQVRLFAGSVLLFVLASWLCGLAPNIESLILFRVIQGLVAGPMIPLSQTLLLGSYPRAKAGSAMALWAMTTLVAPVVGPLLGGWITDNFAWPWIFYINVPVGLFAALFTWSIYSKRETPRRRVPVDALGLVLIVLWIGAFQVMIATVAFAGFALVLWMRSNFNTNATVWVILIPTLLQGAAMAFFFVPLQAIVFSGLPPEQLPSASGMSNFVRITAGAVGTSTFTTLWENRAALHHAQLAEAVNLGNETAMQALARLGASGFSPEQASATLNR